MNTIWKYIAIFVAYIVLSNIVGSMPTVYLLLGTALLVFTTNYISKSSYIVLPFFLLAINMSIPAILSWAKDEESKVGIWEIIEIYGFEGYAIFFGPSFVAFIIILGGKLITKSSKAAPKSGAL